MPRVNDIMDQLAGATVITKLDLRKGFYQIPLSEEDKEKTTFICPLGKYQFTRMPFGLMNVPTTFQHLMDNLFAAMEDRVLSYVDDLAVFSKTWEEHKIHLQEVLDIIKKDGPYKVGNGRIEPVREKVTAILDFPRPKTKKDVRAWLGLTGY